MRFAIYGTGGLGAYYGIRLQQAGHEVAFVARGAHLEAIRANGLKLASPLGDAVLTDLEISDDPAELGPVDAVLVAEDLADSGCGEADGSVAQGRDGGDSVSQRG